MKILICFIGLYLSFFSFSLQSQCINDFYAMYYLPDWEYDGDTRLKILFKNASDSSDWNMPIQYVKKGNPLVDAPVRLIEFTALNQVREYLIDLDSTDNQYYDLYVCGVMIGSFQKEHALLEINVDFDIKKNRLYYWPFKRSHNANFPYPDFQVTRINYNSLLSDGDRTYSKLRMNHGPTSYEGIWPSVYFFKRMKAFGFPSGKIKISCDLKDDGDGMHHELRFGLLYGGNGINSYCHYTGTGFIMDYPSQNNSWVHFEDILEIDPNIPGPYHPSGWCNYSNDEYGEKNYFSIMSGPSAFSYVPETDFIDNLKISLVGGTKYLCFGDSLEIYGEMVKTEGIYHNAGVDSLIDSNTVFKTVLFYPKIFVDYSNLGYYLPNNEDWHEHSWRSCEDSSIVYSGEYFEPIENGNYFLIVNNGACADTSTCFSVNNLGIEQVELPKVKIYPNPGRNVVYIDLNGHLASQIKIVDIQGRVLETIDLEGGKSLVSVQTKNYSTGLYFVYILSSGETIIVENLVIE